MNHVQIIKNRFEALRNSSELCDSLDLSLRPKKPKEPGFKAFQRSATLIDFSRFKLDIDDENDNSEENDTQTTKDPVNHKHESHQFQRQSSNGSNSSYKSIRRSPAFRLDIQRKPNLGKNLSTTTPTKLLRQSPVKQIRNNNSQEVEYIASSETIKKALRNPLPSGPPPPKPPRIFASSPRNSPVKDVCIASELENKSELSQSPPDSNTFRIQIDDLEKKLHFKTNTFPKKATKSDDKKGISTFLNCIISPCSIDPIYYEQIRREQAQIKKKKIDKEEPEEEIYMEPFAHLDPNFNSNFQSSPKTEELHYMCTNIVDQTNNNSSTFESNDLKRRSSLEYNDRYSSDKETFEKINLLMDVVYDEKHRDNIMEETSGSSTEMKSPMAKVTRSLTEKRKNYVRRMTQSITAKEISAASYGSLHKLPSTSSIISQFQRIIDSNTGSSPKSSQMKGTDEKLFKMSLLIGYDMLNKKGYIKSIYPKSEKPLPMLEQFVYPTDKNPCDYMTKENQNFTLILTDEYGNHIFCYARQIIPEGFEKCLPLTYCIISNVKATGFYFNVLKEIESRHGYPESQFTFMLRTLQNQELPKNGKFLHIKLLDSPSPKKIPEISRKPDREAVQKSQQRFAKRLSLESPDWLKAEAAAASQQKPPFDLTLINRSLTECSKRPDEILIRRPNDVRLENAELSVLYESTTSDLLLKIFGTLLIERKVIILGKSISQISSCVMALYSILYPFQWHHTIIAIVPEQIIELIQAPFPFFAGVLKTSIDNINSLEVEDGIVVDLETKTLIRKCGDEITLLPETLRKSLMLSLKIVEAIDKGKKLANVLIAEAFLQFFVKLFAHLDARTFDKNRFIEMHNDQGIKYFLEWFLDTIMFKEFLSKKQNHDMQRDSGQSNVSNYFDLFNIKVLEKSATLSNNQQRKNVETLMKSSKQKKRNFKDKIKDFLNHN